MSQVDDKSINGVQQLRILTFNIGLLSFKLFGMVEVYTNPPFCAERLPFILQALGAYKDKIDVLCIQECYEDTHAQKIIDIMKSDLPYYARGNTLGAWSPMQFHNGMLTLTRFPILQFYLQPLRKVAFMEKQFGSKVNLIAIMEVPSLGKVLVANLHTTAGGLNDPEDATTDVDRQDELQQVYEACEAAKLEYDNSIACLLTGDFNCGPEVSCGNFNFILAKGYLDAYALYLAEQQQQQQHQQVAAAEAAEVMMHTWDPKNFLNTLGPHKHCAGQRIDHVLVAKDSKLHTEWKVTTVQKLFTEEVVPLRHKKSIRSTISDHYGLLFVFERRK